MTSRQTSPLKFLFLKEKLFYKTISHAHPQPCKKITEAPSIINQKADTNFV